MFFGMPARIVNGQGKAIPGTMGFVGALLKIIRRILPAQYADFKSMTGEASDNIRGADRIGPKTAVLLLNEFGTVEGILANAAAIGKPSIRESVIR